MKRILILLLGLFSVAYGQFAPTSAKTAFKWGVSIGTRDSTAYAANDSLVVVINRQGRMMYRSTDGYWKLLANAASSDYVPYTGAVNNVSLGNFRLTTRSVKTDSIYANSSAGMYLTTNTGTAVAHWGGGGSVEVDFKGFAGYDANRASSYTARSFTDKNYVDSSAALRVRYTDTAAMLAPFVQYSDTTGLFGQVVRTFGTQTIGGNKTFSDSTIFKSVTRYDSTAKFFKRIIVSPTGNSYFQDFGIGEDGPSVYINRNIDGGTDINEHGFIDATTFKNRTNRAYNSYDAQATMSGTVNLDHHAAFQSRPNIVLTGGATITNLWSYLSAPNVSSGNITNLYHFQNFPTIGSASVQNEYGLYIKQLRGVRNYGIYVEVDSSFFGNQVQALSFKKTGGTSSQFLKADGSVDGNTYLTSSDISVKLNISDTATMLSNYRRTTTKITNSDLANSNITINGSSTSLGGSVSVGTVTSVSAGTGMSFTNITGSGAVNADTTVLSTRAYAAGLDVAKANTSLNNVNGVLSSTYGGAGSVSGILKANGSGVVSAAVAGTDYAPAVAGGYLPLSGGTLSGNLSTSSSITLNNGQFYQAKRNTGSATVNILGFESGTDDLIQVTSNDFKLRNTGTGDAANIFKVSQSGAITTYGAFTNNIISNSGFEVPNGQFYKARRSSGSLLTDMIGIPSGTDNVRILTTGDLNIVNGSLTNLLTVNNSGDVLVAGATTDGTNKLIVNGGVKFGTGGTTTITAAGAATFSSSVTVGGALSFSPSSSKIVSGITDFAIRNNADNTSMLHFNNSTLAATFTGSVYGIGFRYAYAAKSSNYTLTDNDDYINVTSSCTITLPTAVGRSGKRYVIKAVFSGSTVNVTMASTSSQTIDTYAPSTFNLTAPSAGSYNILVVYSDGANWFTETWATGA